MQNPGRTHWEAVKRILPYLKKMCNFKLTFGKVCGDLEAFSNADWGSQYHRHSISGYAVILNGGAVAFGSMKQGVIALSTAEAQCIALILTRTNALFVRNLLSEVICPFQGPILLHCNNQAAIAILKTSQYHQCLKHIDMHFKYMCQAVKKEEINVTYCPTDYMPADIFMKPLRSIKMQHFSCIMGLE